MVSAGAGSGRESSAYRPTTCKMVNTSPIEAVSIHLYSPPLDRTDFGVDRAVEFTVVSVAP
jgi:hypothetical protein